MQNQFQRFRRQEKRKKNNRETKGGKKSGNSHRNIEIQQRKKKKHCDHGGADEIVTRTILRTTNIYLNNNIYIYIQYIAMFQSNLNQECVDSSVCISYLEKVVDPRD